MLAHFDSPDWARDAVWYQVFPERFRNGCPASNPTAEYALSEPVPGWAVSSWSMDWYSQTPWEVEHGDFYHAVHARRFGGDLPGLYEKLSYLQDLGINAIYLNPVFMAPSLHKYDAAAFHHIDPTLGPDFEGDMRLLKEASETEDPSTWIWTAADRMFTDLVAEIHRRGMRVIIDGVFNHTGARFFAFQDLLKHGRESSYRDWYRIQRWFKNGKFRYKGWYGHKALPEFGRSRDNLHEPVRDYLFNITRRWMDPDGEGGTTRGVDGWRLDVAYCVPHGFWKEWRQLVKSINPDAYLCGEIVRLAKAYLQGDELDAVMNYMWTYPTLSFFSPGSQPLSAREFRRKLNRILRAYPDPVSFVLQNLLDSHDTGRVLTMLENPDVPKTSWDDCFDAARAKSHPSVITTRPGTAAVQALRQIVIFQMTYIGAPMIYYGTEVGMWGANDPDNRQPMLWDDVDYEPEVLSVQGSCAPSVRAPDLELFAFYQRAIALRRECAVLRRGELRWLDTGHDRLLGFLRIMADQEITVLLNAGDDPVEWMLDHPADDLWNVGKQEAPGSLIVEPRGWRILKKRAL